METKGAVSKTFAVGDSLPPFQKSIAQADIDRYARVSGDFNPIHTSPEYARKTPLGTTVAHGMLLLAYISQVMTKAFGTAWLENGKMYARFKAPARPGDTVSISGKITRIETCDQTPRVHCEIVCRNQDGTELILSKTEVQVMP